LTEQSRCMIPSSNSDHCGVSVSSTIDTKQCDDGKRAGASF